MSTDNRQLTFTLSQTTSRRSFLKGIAAGTATAALIATARIADAGRPVANREQGTAPVIGAISSFQSPVSAPKRFERRTAE
jgi:hypothetical protein